jgi:hypothetical protein
MPRQFPLNPHLVDLLRMNYPAEMIKRDGKTKSFTRMLIHDMEFSLGEYNRALQHVKDNPIKVVAPEPVAMSPEEFATFSRLAIPTLMRKLYMMAEVSEDPKVVLAALKEFADRSYGKATQSVQVNLGPDVRGAWKELEKFDRPLIEGYMTEDTEKVLTDNED